MRFPRARTACTVALLALLAGGCGDDDESKEPSREDVQAALEKAVDAGAPGIAVEIRRAKGGREFLTAGAASLTPRRRIRPDDRFRIASVTKSFTAAIVMELVEKGRLSLDGTVEKVTPGLIGAGDRVTIAQLLQHTSGLPDYVKEERFIEQAAAGKRMSPRQALDFVAKRRLEFKPGTKYAYSDTDNIVLGMIIEKVTGNSFERELRSRVLKPLQLDKTTLATKPGMPRPHVNGYQYDPQGGPSGKPVDVTDLPLDPNGAWASGALISTPRDVTSFFGGLLSGKLVDREQLEKMMDTVPGKGSPPGPGKNYAGLGIFGYELSCGEVWGHTGSFPGYRAFGAASPDGGGAVAVLVNVTEVPARTDKAIVRAQELASCRALGKPAG